MRVNDGGQGTLQTTSAPRRPRTRTPAFASRILTLNRPLFSMTYGFRLVLLLLVVTLAGCTGFSETAERDLDRAALALDDQLGAPGLLAATAILHHAAHGTYPADAFGLLGSTEAQEAGLRELPLSALTLTPGADSLTLRYTLLPTAADPSDRFGTITVAETDTAGTYTVDLLMERIADPDLDGRALPLTQEGQYAVVRAKGSLCAEVEALRARPGREAGQPPLDDRTTYTVTFTPTDDTPAPAALREGVSVTLPR